MDRIWIGCAKNLAGCRSHAGEHRFHAVAVGRQGRQWSCKCFPGRPWSDESRTNLNTVGDGFFDTLRIPLIAGRTIERRDMRPEHRSRGRRSNFCKAILPKRECLRTPLWTRPKNNDTRSSVLSATATTTGCAAIWYPTVYEPYRPGGTNHFAIRANIDSARLAEAVRKAVASVDPAVPLTEFPHANSLDRPPASNRALVGVVAGAFGLVALTLAAIGLGGLLAYAVARRTNEIGVRMALGAAAGDVIRMVLRDSLWMVGIGILIGLPCAYAIGRFLTSSLFQLEPFDVRTSAGAVAVLLVVALVAAWVPARRAARIDPILALREE